MKVTKRLVLGVVVLLVWLAAGSSQALAQDFTEHVQIRLDMLNLAVSGGDLRIGDIFSFREENRSVPGADGFFYGSEYEPIRALLGKDRPLAWSVRAGSDRWGVRVTRWQSSYEGTVAGRVESSPVESRFAGNSFASSQVVRGVKFWDHSLVPVANFHEKSKLSPVDFYGLNGMTARKTEAVVERRLLGRSRSRVGLNVHGGMAFGRFEHTRAEGQAMEAHVQYPLVSQEGPPFSVNWLYFDNQISLDSRGSAAVGLMGPSFGLDSTLTAGRVELGLRASQSVALSASDNGPTWMRSSRPGQGRAPASSKPGSKDSFPSGPRGVWSCPSWI